jgi:Zinc dependent phospholipase C
VFVRAMLILALLFASSGASGYSVLTHEELVDLAWSTSIRPMLLARYPALTAAQLRQAHAYAYGGCLIQDMGYYPFGQQFFSDLTHYVRSGDFVAALFRDAKNANELAFSAGALSHYFGDSIGHSMATNPATAVSFPNLEKKFGPEVTYDESPHAHVRTEFAFDVGQLAKHHFPPPAYLRYIGFHVPRHLLDQAFRETYSIPAPEILGPVHPALKSYEKSVRSYIPAFSTAEVVLHGKQFPNDLGDPPDQLFSQRLSEVAYQRDPRWQKNYGNPGFKAHMLAGVIWVLPKFGSLSMLAIKVPSDRTEDWYVHSVNRTVDELRHSLEGLHDSAVPNLRNLDLDTGDAVSSGSYPLTDETYAKLLDHLTRHPERTLPAGIQANILAFYRNPDAPNALKKDKDKWQRVQQQLDVLRTMPSK